MLAQTADALMEFGQLLPTFGIEVLSFSQARIQLGLFGQQARLLVLTVLHGRLGLRELLFGLVK